MAVVTAQTGVALEDQDGRSVRQRGDAQDHGQVALLERASAHAARDLDAVALLVPEDDLDLFKQMSDDLTATYNAPDPAASAGPRAAFDAYFAEVIDDRRKMLADADVTDPGPQHVGTVLPDDLISGFVVAEVDDAGEGCRSARRGDDDVGGTVGEKVEPVPFFMEQVRGDKFRLFVDLDIKRTVEEPYDAQRIVMKILQSLKHIFPKADVTSLACGCHGPWRDAVNSDAVFKTGIRIYCQPISRETPAPESLIAPASGNLCFRDREQISR